MATGNSWWSGNIDRWFKPLRKIGNIFMNTNSSKQESANQAITPWSTSLTQTAILSPQALQKAIGTLQQNNLTNTQYGHALFSTGTAPVPEHCRWCGKDVTEVGYEILDIRACEGCSSSVFEQLFISTLPLIPEVSCQTCKSHINACICPLKQALNNLKNDGTTTN